MERAFREWISIRMGDELAIPTRMVHGAKKDFPRREIVREIFEFSFRHRAIEQPSESRTSTGHGSYPRQLIPEAFTL